MVDNLTCNQNNISESKDYVRASSTLNQNAKIGMQGSLC